jgi:hypothetical protein
MVDTFDFPRMLPARQVTRVTQWSSCEAMLMSDIEQNIDKYLAQFRTGVLARDSKRQVLESELRGAPHNSDFFQVRRGPGFGSPLTEASP